MILRFWSVPVISETSVLDFKKTTAAQRVYNKTTIYDIRNRQDHTLVINLFGPGAILRMLPFAIFYFVGGCIITLVVPGILATILKDATPSWLFLIWALLVLIIAVIAARSTYLSKRMEQYARTERQLAQNQKIAIIKEKNWNRWLAKMKLVG